ncbi:M3 family metallopeptidase [Nibricoccus sp. IMCC34717]|uniref:M3 family metallopeptidase n=1 Tax=Nibricoccus sp. IMCC34717 TaxID=3034021 RepID=UPI00384C8A1A
MTAARLRILSSLVLGFLLAGASIAVEEKPPMNNPLLAKSPLPFEYPQFNLIQPAHFPPAFDAAMAENRREIDAVATNAEAPTFANTFVALERSGLRLSRVRAVFSNLTSAHTNKELDAIDEAYAPKFAAHSDALYLNEAIFKRIDAVFQKRASLGLDAEALRLVERYHQDFVRAGARLTGAERERVKAINAEVAGLETRFGQLVLKETNDRAVWISDAAALKGLANDEIEAAAEAAKKAGRPGGYLLRLMNTTGQPMLASLENRATREQLYRASIARGNSGGDGDTRALFTRLAQLKAERAALLGHASYAAYFLDDQTAKTVGAVNDLLGKLSKAAVANAKKEAADMQALIDREGGGFALAPWDWAFYAERVRKEKYAFDEGQLKPYFEANRVLIDGVFFAAQRLYGLSFKERHDLPVYEPSVRVFDVFNEDGSQLAVFIFDLFARPSKRGGAWMNSYVDQSSLLGTIPIVGNHMNVPPPAAGQPALMTYDEVNTLFHEFGHALHGMLSRVRYPYFSGTAVPRDFVEFPSQVNEMWDTWPEVLANYAKHYQTGEPMPAALMEKMLATEKFNQGFLTTEYLAAALLDQGWHQLRADQVPTAEQAMDFEAAQLHKFGVDFAPVPPRYRSSYFNHIFTGGYSAGYYSYIWAEVLDAQTVDWIKAHGGLTRANGDHLRKALLSRGGSSDAMVLFRELVGADPDIRPLLERRGLE